GRPGAFARRTAGLAGHHLPRPLEAERRGSPLRMEQGERRAAVRRRRQRLVALTAPKQNAPFSTASGKSGISFPYDYSSAFTRATTFGTVKPYSSTTFGPGADAPYVSMPRMS